jgi:hypothetical protein
VCRGGVFPAGERTSSRIALAVARNFTLGWDVYPNVRFIKTSVF